MSFSSFLATLSRRSGVRIALYNYFALALTAIFAIATARLIGPSARGSVSGVLAWWALLAEVGSLGIAFSLTYYLAKGDPYPPTRAAADWLLRRQVAATSLFGALIFTLLPSQLQVLGILYALTLPLAFISSYRLAELLGLGRLRDWNQARTACALLPPIAGLTAALVAPRAGPVLIGYGIGSLGGTVIAAAKLASVDRFSASVPIAGRRLLSYGVRTAVTGVLSSSNRYLDIAIMTIVLPSVSVGLYASAVALSAILLPFGRAIAASASSRLPALSTSAQQAATWHYYRQSAAICLLTGLAGALLARPLVAIALGNSYRGATTATAILFPAAAVLALIEVGSAVSRGRNRPSQPTVAQLLGLLITAFGIIPAVKAFGIAGAAWVSLASYVTTLFALLLMTHRADRRANAS
ncbi:MAG TPA: polysaccharide biosynthesis C-terminal domain-containing protein [Acidimicrobiales bacterium]|nr:polysaccharide biosynthesis C-terminal domain-containing protein [Acidimicrobiales bacterium]